MIEPCHPNLSLSGQCHLLCVSRSSLYHSPKGESSENLALMRRLDELFLNGVAKAKELDGHALIDAVVVFKPLALRLR